MPKENEIIPYSLCDDCPIKDDCKTSKWGVQIFTCERRAKHEAPEQSAEE